MDRLSGHLDRTGEGRSHSDEAVFEFRGGDEHLVERNLQHAAIDPQLFELAELDVLYRPADATLWSFMRPDGRPSFTPSMLHDFEAWQRLIVANFGPGQVPLRYLVLGSRSPGVFCFGGDLSLFERLIRTGDRDGLARYGYRCVEILHRNMHSLDLPMLTIGLVQGAALYVMFYQMGLPFGFAQACLLAAGVLALLWTFRSVVWPRVVFGRELSCDERVAEAVQNPLVVAASLVQVWRLQRALSSRSGARWIHAHPLVRTRPSVEQRVRRLMEYRPDPRRAWLATARRVLTTAALLWTSLFLWTYHTSDLGSELRAQLRETAPELGRPRR